MDDYKGKQKRAPTALTVECSVCGAPAPDHIHFGGTCCYSCRAFFRRTVERMGKVSVTCRTGTKDCEVTEFSKVCSACRFDKCLKVGMKVELLQGKRRRRGALGEESITRTYENESSERVTLSHHQGNIRYGYHHPQTSSGQEGYNRQFFPDLKRDHTGAGVIQRQNERNDLPAIRHSVIQHSNTRPKSASLNFPGVPFPQHSVQSLPQYQLPPTVPFPTEVSRFMNPSRSSAMLREEARMMRYNAHMMIQQSRLLEAQADMMDEDDNHDYERRDVFGQRRETMDHDNYSIITDQDLDIEVIPKEEPMMSPTPDNFHNPDPQQSAEIGRVRDNSEMNNIEKDIKNIIKSVVCASEGGVDIDEQIFESKIFREADQLLCGNTQFSDLIFTVAQELSAKPSKPEKVRKIEPAKESKDEPVNLSTNSKEYEVEKKIKTFTLVQLSEFPLTNDEMTWADKMYQNIANTMKLMIRPEFYQGVMDLQLGNINPFQFKQMMMKGRQLQTYSHLMIISNLPYFHDISLRTQRYLIRENINLCSELFTSVGFFLHQSECWYDDTGMFPLRFREYCKTFGVPEDVAKRIKPPDFSTFVSPRIFDDVRDYGRYFEMLKKAASLLEDFKCKGIMGVLYAMSFFTASVDHMKANGIPQEDIDTIEKASSQLTTVYKRLVINETGWKKGAAGKFLTHGFCLGILKTSSNMIGNAIRKRREQATIMPPTLTSTNLNNIAKFPPTFGNMDTN